MNIVFFQLHRGNHLIKLTCMTSEDDHGGVYAFQNCSFFLVLIVLCRSVQLYLCYRYIQGASSPKDMVILVDV